MPERGALPPLLSPHAFGCEKARLYDLGRSYSNEYHIGTPHLDARVLGFVKAYFPQNSVFFGNCATWHNDVQSVWGNISDFGRKNLSQFCALMASHDGMNTLCGNILNPLRWELWQLAVAISLHHCKEVSSHHYH